MQTYTNKEIASALYKEAAYARDISRTLANQEPKRSFKFGTLTIRCLDCRSAIQQVADKFDGSKRFTTKSCNETAAVVSTRNRKPARITTTTLLKRHGGVRVCTGDNLDSVIHL